MKNIGAWLIIALGCLLTVGNFGAGSADVGIATVPCGGAIIVGTAPTCPVGSIAVTKTVVGTGTAPAGGWTVTIGSTNCAFGLVGRNDLVLTIPPGGGVGTVPALFVTTNSLGTTPCQYTVTETAVAAWTPSFVPAGPTYTVAANQTTAIALTNTADPATTTTALTTNTMAATTTAVIVVTTALPTTVASIAPATSTAAADTPTTPTMPPAIALPATGSPSTRPTTYIGLALIALGTLILVNRRRQSHSPTD